MNVKQIYICGIASYACVKYTCFGALAKNFECHLIRNAHSGWNQNQADLIAQTEKELAFLGVKMIDYKEI
jgi:nicotinamidase-related amidase